MSVNKLAPANDAVTRGPQQLPSPAPGLAIWRCHLEQPGDEIATLEQCLSAAERQRAARFGAPLLRTRYVVGRAWLRWVLGRTLGMAPQAVLIRAGRRGRPYVPGHDVDFNVSHTQATALIGIADLGRIGVDIESSDRRVNVKGLERKFMTACERDELASLAGDSRRHALLRLWTCKEALSKATGDALGAPFRELELVGTPAPRLLAGPPPYLPADWQLFDVALADNYFATAAWWRRGVPESHGRLG